MEHGELYNFLREAIREALIIKEVDVKNIDRRWKGAYAFAMAYNKAMAMGLFPRSQPLNIEFSRKFLQHSFKNNTLYVIPTIPPSRGFFITGPGHDFTHILSQNLIQHFHKKTSEFPSGKMNKSFISLKDIKRFLNLIKQELGFDLLKKFPIKLEDLQKNDQLRREWGEKIFIFFEDLMHKADSPGEKEEYGNLMKIFSDNIMQSRDGWVTRFDPEGNLYNKRRSTPGHAFEEEMGNEVGEKMAMHLANGLPVEQAELEEMLNEIRDYALRNRGSMDIADAQIRKNTIQKWVSHFEEILPKFIGIYNNTLAMLDKTKFGFAS